MNKKKGEISVHVNLMTQQAHFLICEGVESMIVSLITIMLHGHTAKRDRCIRDRSNTQAG